MRKCGRSIRQRDWNEVDGENWEVASRDMVRQNEKKSNEKTKKRGAQKKWSVIVRGVSPEAGRESIVGKVCELGRS